jgi:hypothetical protein
MGVVSCGGRDVLGECWDEVGMGRWGPEWGWRVQTTPDLCFRVMEAVRSSLLHF